jgi:hypothetical protein
MPPFLFICPNTGFRVQGYAPEQTSDDGHAYQAVKCLICAQLHLVDLTTGRVLGQDDA